MVVAEQRTKAKEFDMEFHENHQTIPTYCVIILMWNKKLELRKSFVKYLGYIVESLWQIERERICKVNTLYSNQCGHKDMTRKNKMSRPWCGAKSHLYMGLEFGRQLDRLQRLRKVRCLALILNSLMNVYLFVNLEHTRLELGI